VGLIELSGILVAVEVSNPHPGLSTRLPNYKNKKFKKQYKNDPIPELIFITKI